MVITTQQDGGCGFSCGYNRQPALSTPISGLSSVNGNPRRIDGIDSAQAGGHMRTHPSTSLPASPYVCSALSRASSSSHTWYNGWRRYGALTIQQWDGNPRASESGN